MKEIKAFNIYGNIILIIIILIFSMNLISASNVGLIENPTWYSNMSGVFHSSLASGDIDGDGDSDLIGMGCVAGGVDSCTTADKIRVYINNGTTYKENFTWEQNTTNLGYGSLSLGDIDNDGKLDLVAMGDMGGGIGKVKVYINNGTIFNENSDWETNLSNIDAYAGSVVLGDVNNDGKLDLALVGASPSTNNGVYINNGTTFVKDSTWLSSLPLVGHGLGMGTLAFADVNNDNNLDLIFAGSYSTNFYAAIYINNGSSLVDNSSWRGDFTATFGWPSLTLGDFNNDNKLDLAVIGTRVGDHFEILENNGTSFIENTTEDSGGSACIPGYFDGSIEWGDYDNDGDLDLAALGKETGRARIIEQGIENEWGCSFASDSLAHANISNGLMQGSLSWLDIEGDNNLDLALNALDTDTSVSRIYISNVSLTKNNTLPSAPTTGFSSSYSEGVLNLSWGNGSDDETPTNGLYYNLMAGNSTHNNTIVSGVYGGSSNPTAGYFGNMMQRKSISLNKYLAEGTYYWYVQTIDTGLAKSSWSAIQSITVGNDIYKPNITSISSSVTSSTATITWTTDESANSSIYYGKTTAVSSSSGNSDLVESHSVTLTGLTASTFYYYNVSSCDYWGNCNISAWYSFTTSGSGGGDDAGGGSSSGGSSNSFWIKTEIISEDEFINGIEKELSVKNRLQISIDNETHYIGVININESLETITINVSSNPIQIILEVGEEKKIELTNDDYYDIYLKLNSIADKKANFTIKKIHEEIIYAEKPNENNEEAGNVSDGDEDKNDIKNERELRNYFIAGIAIITAFILGGIIFLIKKLKWRNKNGRNKNR